jgi:transketolase
MRATREAFGEHLPVMGEKHNNIVALDADLGKATKIASFRDSHPDRFFQIGIAEANMIGVASGISEYGCKDGVTQMGLEDVSIMRALPNMKVLNPATFSEAKKVIEFLAETELDSPYYLRLGRQPVKDIDIPFEIGKGQIIKEGDDITLLSTGCILSDVMDSASIIEDMTQMSVRVVSFTSLKPIDRDLIVKCAQETKRLFTIEDHSIIGGLGSIVSDVLSEEYPAKVVKIGLNDVFPESAPPADLYEKYGLSSNQISKRVVSELDK